MIANIISTHRCNLRCKHCYYANNLQIEDSNSVIRNWNLLLSKREELDFNKFNFSGGEATTSPHLSSFFANCIDRSIPFSLFSNGITVNNHIIDMCDEYHLSVDGVGFVHDNVRNYNGAYEKMYSLLKKLKGLRKIVHVQTTVNRLNIVSLDPLLQVYSEFVPILKSVNLVGAINQGNTLLNELALTDEELLSIKDFKEKVLDTLHYHVFVRDNLYTLEQIKEFVLSSKSTFPIWIDLVSGEAYIMAEKYKTPLDNLTHEWMQEQYQLIRDKIRNRITFAEKKLYIIEELI